MAATGNEVITLNQLKYTKDKLSSSIAAEATERQNQDKVLDNAIKTKLGTQSVIAGNNVTVTPDDTAHTVTISAQTKYTLPAATSTALGGVKIGTGIAVTDDGTISAKHDNHPGTGHESIALGERTDAAFEDSIAIGVDATIPKENGNGTSAIALGHGSKALGSSSIAIGDNAKTENVQDAISIGKSSNATAATSIAIGSTANASKEKSVAIGAETKASGEKSISIGYDDRALATGSIVIGDTSLAEQNASNTIVIGQATAFNDAINSVVIGTSVNSRSSTSVIIGASASIDENSDESVAIGPYIGIQGAHNTAVGAGSNVSSEDYGSAFGFDASVNHDANNGTAIGAYAGVLAENSVALGYNSHATEANTVSLGRIYNDNSGIQRQDTRRIVNVTDPKDSQDAATKAYVDKSIPGIATASKAGIVKPGTGLTVTDDGTLNAETYVLPVATTSTLGGVKPGTGIAISSDGTISTEAYALPKATSTTLGGIKVGSNLSIADDGTLSAQAEYSLPIATTSTLGGVKIGSGINISSDGTIDVKALVDRITELESKVAAGGGGNAGLVTVNSAKANGEMVESYTVHEA